MKVFRITLFFITTLCYFTSYGQNQEGRIMGTVIDSLTKQVMPFANISLQVKNNESKLNELTDREGNFNFKKVKLGKYNLIISYIGYKSKSIEMIIGDKNFNIDLKNISISLENIGLNEVTVKATKPFIQQEVDKIILNVSGSFVANVGNAMDILKRAPSVRIDEQGGISLRNKSVIILIDGRRSNVTGESLETVLTSLTSQGIDTIELMSNPGAKYDASGAAVINIRTIKMKNFGTNGTFTAGVGMGILPSYNTGLQLSHKKEKCVFNGNYNYQYTNQYNNDPNLREFKEKNTITRVFDDNNHVLNTKYIHFYKGSIDYFVSNKTTIGIIIQGDATLRNRTADAISNIGLTAEKPDSIIKSTNIAKNNFKNWNTNINFKHQFDKKGNELIIDADYGNYQTLGIDNVTNKFYKQSSSITYRLPLIINMPILQSVNIQSIKADYSQPIKYGVLSVGGQLRKAVSYIDFRFEQKLDNSFSIDNKKSFTYNYIENVNAAYANYDGKYKKMNFQLGVRAEHTKAEGTGNTSTSISRNYWQLFPSIALQYPFSNKTKLTTNYSQKISRPDFMQMSDILWYQNLYFYKQGNPFLKPVISHSLELGVLHNQTWNFNLSYSSRRNGLAMIPKNEGNITIYQIQNIISSSISSFAITYTKQLKKWWNSTIIIENGVIDGKFNALGKTRNTSFFADYSTQNTFTINNTLKFDISGYYLPIQAVGPYTLQPISKIDIGLQKTINKQLELRLGVTDIFDTYKLIYLVSSPNFSGLWGFKPETRFIRLNFSYKFGNSNAKARDKKIGIEKEINRLNTN
jgi:iron complex outermembrane receptor protein